VSGGEQRWEILGCAVGPESDPQSGDWTEFSCPVCAAGENRPGSFSTGPWQSGSEAVSGGGFRRLHPDGSHSVAPFAVATLSLGWASLQSCRPRKALFPDTHLQSSYSLRSNSEKTVS
jgi:hypothetical protein